MSERVYKLLNGSELLVSEEVMGLRQTPNGVPITVDGDYVIDDVLELLDHITQRKNEYREMTYVDLEEKMDLRAERDELEQERDRLHKDVEELLRVLKEVHEDLRIKRFHGAGIYVDDSIQTINQFVRDKRPQGVWGA